MLYASQYPAPNTRHKSSCGVAKYTAKVSFCGLKHAISPSLDGCATEQGEPNVSRALLCKFSKQQHLLLCELERTRRRLREEQWMKEERSLKTALDPPTRPNSARWHHHAGGDSREEYSDHSVPLCKRLAKNKRGPATEVARDRSGLEGACFKRSRSEDGANVMVTKEEMRGCGPLMTTVAAMGRPSPATKIDMLPVMSSTGEISCTLHKRPYLEFTCAALRTC